MSVDLLQEIVIDIDPELLELHSIKRGMIPLLSPEEERAIFQELENDPKNQAIVTKIVLANLGLVYSQARKYYTIVSPVSFNLEDLTQEGLIGLLEGIGRFDWRRNNKFSTYAVYWIKQRIMRSLTNYDAIIRKPVHVVEEMRQFKRAEAVLWGRLERKPVLQEIAEEAKLGLEKAERLYEVVHRSRVVSLDDPCCDDEEEGALMRTISSDENTEESIIPNQRKAAVSELLASILTHKERKVIELRFGIEDNMERTLEQVGKEFGVTRERIRQIESKAFVKIRHMLAKKPSLREELMKFL